MKTPIYIAGVAMTRFTRHEASMQDLAQTAVLGAVADAGIELPDVEAIYACNVFGGMALGQVLMRDLNLDGQPIYNVENACASGGSAMHLAVAAIASGMYRHVLVLGAEEGLTSTLWCSPAPRLTEEGIFAVPRSSIKKAVVVAVVEGGPQTEEVALEDLVARWPHCKAKVLEQLKSIGLELAL